MHLLKIEFYKLRRKKMLLVIGAVTLLQLVFMLYAVRRFDQHDLEQGWRYCLYNLAQVNCMMMPMLMAMLASRISDIEHKGNNFKCLKTLVRSQSLFHTKVMCGGIYVVLTVLLQVGMLFVLNGMKHFQEAMPVPYLIYYFLSSVLMDMVLYLLQLNLSLLIVNQLVGFIVAIAGAFIGIYSMFFGEHISQFILWGYYALLSPIRMNWDEVTRIVDLYWIDLPMKSLGTLILLGVTFYGVGKNLFVRKEC